jgi:inhibitor of cysteine peptidase
MLVKSVKRTILFSLFLGSLLVVASVIGMIESSHSDGYETLGDSQLKTFSSYEELKNFLNASSKRIPRYLYNNGPVASALTTSTAVPSTEATNPTSAVPKYSTTNIQVEGVDEADIVKTDGEYIYVISNQSVIILKAYPPTEAEILSQIKFNGTLKGVFISDDRLVAFEESSPCEIYPYTRLMPMEVSYGGRTSIRVYDIADRRNPTSTRNVTVDGSYFDSRMMGGYVYVIIEQPVYQSVWAQSGNSECSEVVLPKIYLNGRSEEVPATQIYYSNVTDGFETYTDVFAINLKNDNQAPTHKTFLLGYTSTMYVSQNNIYLTFSDCGPYGTQKTIIHRLHVENGEIEYTASGEVAGYVLNQFSMDEYNEHFRIATTTGYVSALEEATSQNHVYILDFNLRLVGKLDDLAPGEKIYSARFMGNRAYLVTFKKVDPLFVIDLTDPTAPRVLGQLNITGYSDYLQPYDETHIIGIGKETVDAEDGNFAWYQGIKISLFDVSDVTNPKQIDQYEIGDRGTDSPILSDHKALLFDKSKNLLVIPVTVAKIDPTKYPNGIPPYAYGDFVWNGAYVFQISLQEGLVLKGKIIHIDNNTELLKNGFYDNSPYSVKRSLYIGNVLYTISDSKIKMDSLSDLSEINELSLNT